MSSVLLTVVLLQATTCSKIHDQEALSNSCRSIKIIPGKFPRTASSLKCLKKEAKKSRVILIGNTWHHFIAQWCLVKQRFHWFLLFGLNLLFKKR
mmetsp:Transcript_28683/g.39379  ORF Transcript_28683/g.39379 Transcript_28683/m.39379 type:complete len:95 (-) Transcript_28683:240-524(-)